MKILVIGCGYVGLVAAACFANIDNSVICVDNDDDKISKLKNGEIPFYESKLQSIVSFGIKHKQLFFTNELENAIKQSEVIFICVGTPSRKDGSANLDCVFDVAKIIGKNINSYKVIVNKSTAPIGTAEKIAKLIKSYTKNDFDVASNPEFLRQGTAVDDFIHPDRTVIGTNSLKAKRILTKLYKPFSNKKNKIITMDIKSAEMCKYACNAFLATKISFINEIANLCDRTGANIDSVRKAMMLDPRIGNQFLSPGIGYGGSCFPKDVKALVELGKENGYEMLINKATDMTNTNQIQLFIKKIKVEYKNNLAKQTFSICGLSFKPKTSDIREAPSLKIIDFLLANKCKIKVYDPVAEPSVKLKYQNKLTYCSSIEECLINSNGLFIMSNWDEFSKFNYKKNKTLMKNCIVFDARNQLKPQEMAKNDFKYISFGR